VAALVRRHRRASGPSSSMEKEKRRRRSPANGHANPETDMPRCFQEIR